MSFKRRDFLRVAALGTTSLLTGSSQVSAHEKFDCDESFGVLVDTVVCIGCRKCEWACQKAHLDEKKHRRPDESTYTVVNEYRDPDVSERPYFMKVQCMHCNEPACVSACIVGALEKKSTGPVFYDAWKCIGCRYCIVACPFQIPAYEYDNALTPEVRKCTFCYERVIEEGKQPACVEVCPNEALTFGKRKDLINLAYSRIKAHPERYADHVYGEHEVGGTSWLYLASCDFKNTELPVLPDESLPPHTETIQHGIFKWFIPPIALYGFLGLVMFTLDDKKDEQEVEK